MSSSSSSSSAIKQVHKVEVPATCSIEHKAVTLENGVRIVAIVDPDTTTASGAASVFVGSHWDPVETPGLAHLQEHMLFLGTKRDPEEGGFDKYLSKNNGHSNAWTEDGVTNYYFQLAGGDLQEMKNINKEEQKDEAANKSEKLEKLFSDSTFHEALVRFSHFFVEPTMTPNALEREVQAVHSEDEKNHPIDYWCFAEVLKLHLCDKNHPHSRYGNGNAATLWDGPKERGINLHEILLKFYDRHYVAENLVVTIYSPVAADLVISTLAPILKKVRSGTRNVHSFADDTKSEGNGRRRLIAQESLGCWINMKTNSNTQRLQITMPVTTSREIRNRYNVMHYVSWVLGHECKGTIVDVLREEDLCTSLSTGEYEIDDDNGLFTFDITVTTKGLQHLDRVIDLVFEGVQFFAKNVGADPALFSEMVAGDKLHFNMREISNPSSHTSRVARNCNVYGPERCWSATSLLEEMNADMIKDAFAQLTPDNAYYSLHLPDTEKVIEDSINNNPDTEKKIPVNVIKACATPPTQVTTHHKAKFSITPISKDLIKKWGRDRTDAASFHPKYKRPASNPFISTEFAIHTKEGEDGREWKNSIVPKTAHESKWGRVLWRPDAGFFESPKGCIHLSVDSPAAYENATNRFFTRVLGIVLEYALAELTYFGELAAYHVDVHTSYRGLEFVVSGPRHKLLVFANSLIANVFEEIFSGDTVANQEKYEACADRVLRSLQSLKVSAPYVQSGEWVFQYTSERRFHWQLDMLEEINNTIPPFEQFIKYTREVLFNTKVRYDALVTGNVVLQDAVDIGKDILETLITTKLPNNIVPAPEEEFEAGKTMYGAPSRKELADTIKNNKSTSSTTTTTTPFGSLISRRSTNEKDGNSAAAVYFYQGPADPHTRALAEVTLNMLKAHYFEGLRTRETIGYIVFAQAMTADYQMWTRFAAQSAKLPAWYIFSRTYAFLKAAESHIFGDGLVEKRKKVDPSDDGGDGYLNKMVREAAASLAASYRDKPKNLSSLTSRIWNNKDSPYGFDHTEKEADILDDESKINATTIRAFFKRFFVDPLEARVLISLVHGSEESIANDGFDKVQFDNSLIASFKNVLPPREGEVPDIKEEDLATLDLASYRDEEGDKKTEVEVVVVSDDRFGFRKWAKEVTKAAFPN